MKKCTIIITLLVSLISSIILFSQTIPQTINYQGVLKDASGVVAANGDYNITFKLYDVETSGTELWAETKLITVIDGIINTQIGSVTPITLPFDEGYWLGVTVSTGSEMAPRIKLTSVPYSLMTMNVMDASISTSKLQDGSVTTNKLSDNSISTNKIIDGTITATDIGDNQVIKKVNGIRDSVNLVAGSNISITPSGNNLTISSSGGTGGGDITAVTAGTGLTGGGTVGDVTLSIANDGITNTMLQDNSVNTNKILDGTITINDLGDNSVISSKIVDATITATDIASNQLIKKVNGIRDSVNLVAGSNIAITPSGNNLTISSTSSGLGGSGTANHLPIFTNSTTLGNSKIFQATDGSVHIGNNGTNTILTLSSQDNVNEGGQLDWLPAGSHNFWYQDIFGNNMRLRTNTADTNYVEIINKGTGTTGLLVEGMVGIGTTTPTALLDVQGGTNSNGDGRDINLIAESGKDYGGKVLLMGGEGNDDFFAYKGGTITVGGGQRIAKGGDIDIRAGMSHLNGGDIKITSGTGDPGGIIDIKSGSGAMGSGPIKISTGYSGNGSSGDISINSGEAAFGSGSINISTGPPPTNVTDHSINLKTGGIDSEGGSINLETANAVFDNGISLKTGSNTDGAGDIILEVDSTYAFSGEGNIILTPHPGGLVKVNGSGTYTGTWTQASDERFKKNVEPIENAVDNVQRLNGVSYEFKTDEFPEKNFEEGKQIGLIAQDVEKIFPELVETDNEGYKSVAYQNMVAVLIEAVKEQQKSIDELKNEVLELKTKLSVDISAK